MHKLIETQKEKALNLSTSQKATPSGIEYYQQQREHMKVELEVLKKKSNDSATQVLSIERLVEKRKDLKKQG